MRKLFPVLCLPLLFSCGGKQVQPVTSPMVLEEKGMVAEKQIASGVGRPDWGSTPRRLYAKPVWIPPVIRAIYIASHEAPDGSMIEGYYVWKKILPGRWRKPGEDVGRIPLQSVNRESKAGSVDAVADEDARAIREFLKRYGRKR